MRGGRDDSCDSCRDKMDQMECAQSVQKCVSAADGCRVNNNHCQNVVKCP